MNTHEYEHEISSLSRHREEKSPEKILRRLRRDSNPRPCAPQCASGSSGLRFSGLASGTLQGRIELNEAGAIFHGLAANQA